MGFCPNFLGQQGHPSKEGKSKPSECSTVGEQVCKIIKLLEALILVVLKFQYQTPLCAVIHSVSYLKARQECVNWEIKVNHKKNKKICYLLILKCHRFTAIHRCKPAKTSEKFYFKISAISPCFLCLLVCLFW